MLHAIGFPDDQMPQLLVHGWWNLGGAKMSKSAGNIVDPFALADKYGADALRYYLMSDIATGQDADFSEERLIERYNADLANSLGNLLNRSLNMMHRYSPDFTRREINRDLDSREILSLEHAWEETLPRFRDCMNSADCSQALREIHVFATSCDMFIESAKPWLIAKEQNKSAHLSEVLYQVIESLAHYRNFDFASVAESGAWNFRSTELENGVERKRRTVFTRRRGVGEIARWTRCRQTSAVVSADRAVLGRSVHRPDDRSCARRASRLAPAEN